MARDDELGRRCVERVEPMSPERQSWRVAHAMPGDFSPINIASLGRDNATGANVRLQISLTGTDLVQIQATYDTHFVCPHGTGAP